MTKPCLLIAGASARAAAASAARAGLAVAGADCFADADLAALGPAVRIDPYPAGLLEAASRLPPGPWMYTGGIENHPELVDALAWRRPLWGNPGEVVARVRDPLALAALWRAAAIEAPRVALDPGALATDGSWLRKPIASAGGANVAPWHGPAAGAPAQARAWYFQQRCPGTAWGAVFLGHAGGVELLGASEQLVGSDWGGRAFQYVGSLGPLDLTPVQRAELHRIGSALVERAGLRGLFGVDMIADAGRLLPIEVNPRYTASIEVLERACGLITIDAHARACRGEALAPLCVPAARRAAGKAIVYAPQPVEFNPAELQPAGNWASAASANAVPRGPLEVPSGDRASDVPGGPWPAVADLPAAPACFGRGQPVLTVFADGGDLDAVRGKLRAELARWRRRLMRR